MLVTCLDIMRAMENWAPARLAEAWDNIGLLVGSPDRPVRRVLVALDITPELVDMAAARSVDLIVAHHPIIFKPVSELRTDTPIGSLLAALLQNHIAVFAAHTNLDAAVGGVNDILAAKLGLDNIRLLVEGRDKLFKLVVYVPETHAAQVWQAITRAGAGHIGNYSHCTFRTTGTGTFLPLTGTNPFIGEIGQVEQVAEARLETVLPESLRSGVLKAMLAAHPYEEVAYDLYELAIGGETFGLGRVGDLGAAVPLSRFVQQVKTALNLEYIRVAGPRDRTIRTVAVCGGSGAEFASAALAAGADVLVTGDVKYHEAQSAADKGLVILDAGHFATEQPVVAAVADFLNQTARREGWTVEITADNNSRDVFCVM